MTKTTMFALALLVSGAAQAANVPSFASRAHCEEIVGDSYSLLETCLQMEAEAADTLRAMPPVPDRIERHCYELVDSLNLYLTCVEMELEAMGRVQ
jgi:hypothetical protein